MGRGEAGGSARGHLIGCSCHGRGVVDCIAQCDGQAEILLDVLQVEIRLEVSLQDI